MIECGICTALDTGITKVIRRVDITDPEGAAITLYELCRRAHHGRWQAQPEDIRRTYQALHFRADGSVIRLKLLKGYTFTVRAEAHDVRQPNSFDGSPEEAEELGWELTERGWVCPPCVPEAHSEADSDAGQGGLVSFFEETKDL